VAARINKPLLLEEYGERCRVHSCEEGPPMKTCVMSLQCPSRAAVRTHCEYSAAAGLFSKQSFQLKKTIIPAVEAFTRGGAPAARQGGQPGVGLRT
jgi:hypothetical protein